jgi:tetratricopeptide (TPR) repeat protein
MKKMRINYLISLLAAVIILGSCAGLKKMKEESSKVKYDVTPNPLVLKGGQVEATITGKFPEKYFNKKAVLVITPWLKYTGGEQAYPSITLQGESVENNNKVIKNATGGDFTINGKLPYTKDMLVSTLELRVNATLKKEKFDFPAIKLGDGVISTELLVTKDPKAVLLADKFQRVSGNSFEADILYLINKADVRASELKKDNIKGLKSYIDASKNDPKVTLGSVKISAYASPDGTMKLNEKLSIDRKESANKFLEGEFKKSKIEKSKLDSVLTLVNTAEDWDGFKALLEKSDIQDKDLVLRVLSMYSDPDVRNKEIKNISAAFKVIAEKILPQLRRSKLTVTVNKNGYSDDELVKIANSKPDSLNVEELLYAANIVSDLNQKLAIYKAGTVKFASDYRVQNNLGYVYIQLKQIPEAKAAFEAAKAIKEDDAVKNNLGVIALLENDNKKAEEYFTSATGAGDAVNYNLGIIKLIAGDYEAAISYFGNANENNAALAKLLSGKTDLALTTLGSVKNDNALTYYLKAIIGARTSNNDLLFNNLRTAVGKDAFWKTYAPQDVEFIKVFNDETFKSIVK